MNTVFVPHISSHISAPWTAWILLLLIVCIATAYIREPAILRSALKNTIGKIERTYNDTSNSTLTQTMATIFQIGMPAFILTLYFSQTATIGILSFFAITAAILIIDLYRILSAMTINYTFQVYHSYKLPLKHYSDIRLTASTLLIPIGIYIYNYGVQTWVTYLLISILVIYYLLIINKLLQIRATNPIILLYILLYMLTIEWVPLGGLIYSIQNIVL